MNDPLDAVFVTGDESAELKRVDTARKLATYLERMPAELRGMFAEQFQHISSAELAQLRTTIADQARQLEEARELIDQSESDTIAIINMSDGQPQEMAEHLANQLGYWLAAHPAPDAEPQPPKRIKSSRSPITYFRQQTDHHFGLLKRTLRGAQCSRCI